MTKQTKISRLAKLTVALVTSAALMSSVEIANAKGGDHHQNHNAQSTAPRPHFVISGQPANVKRVTRATRKKEMADQKNGCGKIIVPTAKCGVSPKILLALQSPHFLLKPAEPTPLQKARPQPIRAWRSPMASRRPQYSMGRD